MKSDLSTYWPDTESLVTFEPSKTVPTDCVVSAVSVYSFDDNSLLLVDIPRGWDIPGGHIEDGESVFDTAKREVLEEAGGTASNLRVFGSLKIRKMKENEKNVHYPECSYITMVLADVQDIDIKNIEHHESNGVRYVPISDLAHTFHAWNELYEHIVTYAHQEYMRNRG